MEPVQVQQQVCTDCGAPATCAYDYGAGSRLACRDHDPLKPLFSTTASVPRAYRTLDQPLILASTGHLGVRLP